MVVAPTDAQKQVILSDPNKIWAYLNYGREYAYNNWSIEGLTPKGPTAWIQYTDPNGDPNQYETLHPELWGAGHFGAYYWCCVCVYKRQQNPNAVLSCPYLHKDTSGRLGTEMDRLMSQMSALDLLKYLTLLCRHFELVRFKLGPQVGGTLQLDITTPNHNLVRPVVQQIMAMSGVELLAVCGAARCVGGRQRWMRVLVPFASFDEALGGVNAQCARKMRKSNLPRPADMTNCHI